MKAKNYYKNKDGIGQQSPENSIEMFNAEQKQAYEKMMKKLHLDRQKDK